MIPTHIHIKPLERSFFQKLPYKNIAVLTDENTYQFCYPHLKPLLSSHWVVQIYSGEMYKNLKTCEYIWQQLTDFQFDRKSLLINLGGGVIGDMGGFVAATFKRGIDFMNIPTTLLAQVDASVGGKLGIDFQGYKNHIGIFAEPKYVWIDPFFLQTLPIAQFKSGFAEIVKHCLVSDKKMFEELGTVLPKLAAATSAEELYNLLDWQQLVNHSVSIKSKVVEEDPKEKGLRKILNFGHTVGHAIESYLLLHSKPILHGEAVAIGMICEAWLSWQKGLLEKADYQQIKEFLLHFFGHKDLPATKFEEISKLAQQDKKNENQQIQACLLQGIGQPVLGQEITRQEIVASLEAYQVK